MLMKIQFDEGIILTIVFSDIVATLLNENTATHSRFKILIDIQFDFICNISAQSHLTELICIKNAIIGESENIFATSDGDNIRFA